MGCVSGVEPAMVLGNSQQREKLKLEAMYSHPKLQVLKMEVLNLARLFCGWVFILTCRLYRWVPPFYVPEMFGDIHWEVGANLGGGSWSIFLCSMFNPILGEIIQVEEHNFQLGWFNHSQQCFGALDSWEDPQRILPRSLTWHSLCKVAFMYLGLHLSKRWQAPVHCVQWPATDWQHVGKTGAWRQGNSGLIKTCTKTGVTIDDWWCCR